MNRTIIFMVVVATVGASQLANAAIICANTLTGFIAVKGRCSPTETRVGLNNLVALVKNNVQEVAGKDVSQCRPVVGYSALSDTELGVTSASVDCASNEYLLNYGFEYTPSETIVARNVTLNNRGGVSTGVFIVSSFELATAAVSPGLIKPYTIKLTGTCCPK